MIGISEERLLEMLYQMPNPTLIDEPYDKGRHYLLCEILKECQELNPWQTIESAPKDRDLILLFDDIGAIQGKWCEFSKFHAPNELTYFKNKPTHWMELPEPPK